ncbi:DUF732 domain-containing protein [Mycolicibacterium sp. 141076]|uniref:DUF732 domain-containing protein n=1 Tax=Mycolicibacterium sp. 141076 TaxID=3090599 RepID=UPI00299DF00B|nr:DUF732 domain-containing protein [Mycolicibacterium sp. 141076]MDX1879769.1 DUF732 domain-containing protein [Mycolicibacterium sp. 141076]
MKAALAGVVAVTIASAAVLAPSASALPPGCDWNTDVGVAACMGTGGGSFDSSATGGDTGDVGYVSAVRDHVPELGPLYAGDISQLGKNICYQLQHGTSDAAAKAGLASELAKNGYPTRSAPYLVDTARQHICPPRPR